jgi:hypothetical protein
MYQVSDRVITHLGVRGFPPIRQKEANGWGTVQVQEQTVRDLELVA